MPISFKSKFFSRFTFQNSEYKDLSSKYFFLTSTKSAHSIKICLKFCVGDINGILPSVVSPYIASALSLLHI